MATEKASAENARDVVAEDAQAPQSAASSSETARVAEDLDRIAGYLRESCAATTERESALAAEIAERRHEIADRLVKGATFTGRLGQIARDLPERRRAGARTGPVPEINPLLAERLHVFCRDMDELFDTFQSRILHARRMKH